MFHRPTSHARIAISATTVALAFTLVGCSNGPSGSADEEGPLSQYLSALWEGEEWSDEKWEQQQLEVEELVAACMQKEGFDYQPNVQTDGGVFIGDGDEIDWGSEEFIKQYGYGLVEWPGADEMPDFDPGGEYFDPNQEYIDSLSESEQQAFYETLWGSEEELTEEQLLELEETGGYTSDWTQQGCYGAAQHVVYEEDNSVMDAYEDPEFADLFASMEQVWSAVWDEENKHEEIVKLDREWGDCMSDAGVTGYASSMDAQMVLSDELNMLYSGGNDDEWVEPSKDELDSFKEHEIEVALADFECKKKTKYDETVQRITFDLEEKFVSENKPQLDALLAKYATKSEGN